MSFSVLAGSETEYEAHEKLFLTRIDQDGNSISLIDYIENETIYGGVLENGEYIFNQTWPQFQSTRTEIRTSGSFYPEVLSDFLIQI